MAQSRAIQGKKEIAMPPADYIPHPELSASLDYQIANQVKVNQVEESLKDNQPVLEELSHNQDTVDQTEQVDPEVYDEPSKEVVDQPSNKSYETNFKNLREEKERIARERDEMRLQMLEMQLRQYQQQNMPKQDHKEIEEQFQFDLDEDSLVEGKQLKKMAQEMFEMKKMLRNYEKQTSEIKRQSQEMTLELKLKSQYPDFNKVFNTENIDVFKSKYPDLAQSISYIPGDYEKSTAAYTMMKNLGFGVEVTNNYEVNKQKAALNSSKPRTSTSASPTNSDSPLTRVNGFIDGKMSKEAKDQAWKEVQAAIRRS